MRRHPFVIPVVAFMALFFIVIGASISLSGQTVGAADTRVVNVFVGDEKQTVPTRARTVGELLDRMNIVINKGDVVEPSKKTQIIENDFTVNIYRARTVTVVDGKRSVTVDSAEQSPRAVAEEVGLDLFPEDEVELEASENVITDGVVAEKVVVNRSTPVKLVIYGKTHSIRTHAETVGQVVSEKGLNTDDVTIEPPAENKIKPNMVIFVTYPGKKIVTVEEKIAFKEKQVEDPKLEAGQTKLKREGKNGKKIVIYEVDKKNPKKKKALQTVVAKEPVDRVIAVGTGGGADDAIESLPAGSVTGSKVDWMRAAGIPASQYQYADFIISHESGWNPGAVSPNRCIGLGQRCDAGILISACPSWQSDPVCQLGHFSGYANGRYGSWQGAYSAWQAQGWW